METLKPVDHSLLRVNQGTIIVLLIVAYIFSVPALVAIVAAAMLTGSLLLRKPGFYWAAYLLRPLGLAKPDLIRDHPQPHLFAQGFGGVVLVISAAALWMNALGLGWTLAWLVIALAALNLFAGFCAGCAIYYWLNRLRVPGFIQSPPEGVLPGFRPREKTS